MTEFDDTLTRLFAEGRETLPAEEFLENVANGMRRARRRRAIRRAAVVTVAVVLAAILTPYVAEGSLAIANHLTASLPTLGSTLASPAAWMCSLAVTAWLLRRDIRFR